MKKLILTAIAVTMISSPAFADHNGKNHGPIETIIVKVNGMVCDFCARALEKVFYQRDGVEGVDVNLDDHEVEIEIAKGTVLPDEEITKLVTDSGYTVGSITR